MKKVEPIQMTKALGIEVETIVLTKGKPCRHITIMGKPFFTIYEAMINNIKVYALVAHENAFRVFGATKNNSGLILFSSKRKIVFRELAEILVSLEDRLLAA